MSYRATGLLLLAAACLAGCDNPPPQPDWGKPPADLNKQMYDLHDADLRRSAIEKLSGQMGGLDEKHLADYARLAADSVPTVRSAAVLALGRGHNTKFLPPVLTALKDTDVNVRWDAAIALDNLPDPRAVQPLCGACEDTSPNVRAAAVTALRHYKQPMVVNCLLKRLDDDEFSVRFRAARSLRDLTGLDLGTDSERWQQAMAHRSSFFEEPAGAKKAAIAPEPKWPAWDWCGVVEKPTNAPAEPCEPGAAARPWWDWMGVSRKDQPFAPASPATQP
jgi:hypothetical protein